MLIVIDTTTTGRVTNIYFWYYDQYHPLKLSSVKNRVTDCQGYYIKQIKSEPEEKLINTTSFRRDMR